MTKAAAGISVFLALTVGACGSPTEEASGPAASPTGDVGTSMSASTSGSELTSTCVDPLNDAVKFADGEATNETASTNDAFMVQEYELTATHETFTLEFLPGEEYTERRPPPTGFFELHMISEDGGQVGALLVDFRPAQGGSAVDEWDVRRADQQGVSEPVEVVDERVFHGRAGKGRARVSIDLQDLPVQPPFRWYATSRVTEGSETGDVCPNVTSDGAFHDPSELPAFPAD